MPNNQSKHLDLVFSNTIYTEKSSSNVVPCDPYHPDLDIFLPIITDIPSLDKSHTYFNFWKTNYSEVIKFVGQRKPDFGRPPYVFSRATGYNNKLRKMP